MLELSITRIYKELQKTSKVENTERFESTLKFDDTVY